MLRCLYYRFHYNLFIYFNLSFFKIVEYFSDKDLCLEFFKRIEREYDLWKDLLNRLTTELQGSRKPIAWESRKTPSDPFKDILVRLVLPKDTEE